MVVRIILLVILLSIAVFLIIPLCSHNLYCMMFCHKDRKLWKKFIKEYQNFEYVRCDSCGNKLFYSKDNKYHIWIWHNGSCSVFDEHSKCLLCDFDKKMSKIMANKLIHYDLDNT